MEEELEMPYINRVHASAQFSRFSAVSQLSFFCPPDRETGDASHVPQIIIMALPCTLNAA